MARAKYLLGALCVTGLCFGTEARPAPPAPSGTVMGDVAARMQPGTWAELSTAGFGGPLLTCIGGHSILEWTGKATWDPRSQQFLYIGGGHYDEQKFITYSAATNSWTLQPRTPWDTGILEMLGHAYERNAIDPVDGNHFYLDAGARFSHKYDIARRSWSRTPAHDFGVVGAAAQEYFPERGGLVLLTARNVYFFSEQTGQWSQPGNDLALPADHCFASYNPLHQAVLLGGGSVLYKFDSSGRLTRLGNPPVTLGITFTVVTPDPVSGKYLVFSGNGQDRASEVLRFFEYDLAGDTWTQLWTAGQANAPMLFRVGFNPVFYTAAAPATTFGVSMFITYNWNDSKVLLYKHSAGGGPPPPPPPPGPQITEPPEGTTFVAGQTVTVRGTGSNLSWSVNRTPDGLPPFAQGTGSNLTFTVPADSTDSQFIDATLSGDGGSVSRRYVIVAAGAPPGGTPNPSGSGDGSCGALGMEGILPLALIARRRRRSAG